MENNGLKLSKIKTETKSVSASADDLEKVISEKIKTPSFAVAFMDYKVLTGRYDRGTFHFYNNESLEAKYLQKLRVFNSNEELLMWSSGGGFKGRHRRDDAGEETYAVDAEQVLFGTDFEKYNDFTRIFEERGTELFLPFNNISVNENRKRVFIKTRNYIKYNKANQATYTDCRFIVFTDGKEDLK